MRSLLNALLMFAVAGNLGCSVYVGSLAFVAPKPLSPLQLRTAQSRGLAEGRTCHLWVLGVPFGLPHVEDAIADAMAPSAGTHMRHVEIFSVHPIYVVFGWHCYVVRGTVYGRSSTSRESG